MPWSWTTGNGRIFLFAFQANILSILPGCARVNNWSNSIRAQCKLWLTTKWNKHGKQAFWGAFNYSNVWPLFTLLTRQGRDGKLSLLVQIIVECWCWMVVALMVGSREMLATNCLLSVSHALEPNRLCPPWLQHQFRCSPPLRQLSESSVNTHIHRGSHKQTPQEHRQKFWVVHFLHPSFINKEQVEWIHQNLVEFIYEEPLDPCYAIRPMASVVLIIDLCAINVGCRILLHSLLFACLLAMFMLSLLMVNMCSNWINHVPSHVLRLCLAISSFNGQFELTSSSSSQHQGTSRLDWTLLNNALCPFIHSFVCLELIIDQSDRVNARSMKDFE